MAYSVIQKNSSNAVFYRLACLLHSILFSIQREQIRKWADDVATGEICEWYGFFGVATTSLLFCSIKIQINAGNSPLCGSISMGSLSNSLEKKCQAFETHQHFVPWECANFKSTREQERGKNEELIIKNGIYQLKLFEKLTFYENSRVSKANLLRISKHKYFASGFFADDPILSRKCGTFPKR